MKRFIGYAVILVVAISLTLSSDLLFAESKNLKIAMILWRGETEGEKGFKDGLKELGYEVQYTVWNASQDKEELARILRKELKPNVERFDYVYTFGTTVSKNTKTILQEKIPQIFNLPIYPVKSGIVQSLNAPGGNLSGTSSRVPEELIIEAALKLIPFKRLGLLFNPREDNSNIIRSHLQTLAKKFSFELVDLRSPPAREALQQNLQNLRDKSVEVDVVYLPSDSFVVSNAELIGAQLRAAKIKSVGSIKEYADQGALMAFAANFYELGKAAAKVLDRHQKGESLQNIPVQTTQKPLIVINKTTSTILDVHFPEDILKTAILVE